jgi:cell division protein FtsL
MTAIEHQELKGITVKNLIVTIISTASIVISVTTSYFQLKNDIHDIKAIQDSQSRINEIRLKVLESNVAMLQQQVNEFKTQLKN